MTERAPKEPVTIWSFIGACRVACPRCAREAFVRGDVDRDVARLTCAECGHVGEWQGPGRSLRYGFVAGDNLAGSLVLGAPIDPYFHCDVWLRARCCGELLWAYNNDHLAFLKAYVAAPLRERVRDPDHDEGTRNRLLESRLPKWMIAAKNRQAVLQGLSKLAAK